MTKTITDPQLIGAQGEALVSARANAMGFLFSRYGPLEAGIDGLLEVRDPTTQAATGKLVAVQVKTKATGSYTAETDSGFEYLMDENDVEYWQSCNLPVVIVLVHLEHETVYWKSADQGDGPGKRRVHIDKTADVFDYEASERIASLCVAKGGVGIWFPPLKSGENGHLNLLEVVIPETVYVAASPYKSGWPALRELLKHEDRPPDDWIIRGGQFMSFRNPRNQPLSHIVDVGAVEDISAEEVVFPDEESEEHIIIELLRRTMANQLDGVLAYNRDRRVFYFPASPENIERTYSYRSLKQNTSAQVVKKYMREGKIKYVRHHAFEPRFWRFGDRWFLSITPTFVFTWDGFRPDRYSAGRVAGKKQREHQGALTGQFVMWRYLLVDEEEAGAEVGLDLGNNADYLLAFRSLDTISLPNSVPDDIWRSSEPRIRGLAGQGELSL